METERMIKEYKDLITKMQRDLYSKKQDEKEKVCIKEDKKIEML